MELNSSPWRNNTSPRRSGRPRLTIRSSASISSACSAMGRHMQARLQSLQCASRADNGMASVMTGRSSTIPAAGSRTAGVLCRVSRNSTTALSSMPGMGRLMLLAAMMPAHQPGGMRPGYGPDTEQDDQQAGGDAHRAFLQDGHHAVGEQPGSQ